MCIHTDQPTAVAVSSVTVDNTNLPVAYMFGKQLQITGNNLEPDNIQIKLVKGGTTVIKNITEVIAVFTENTSTMLKGAFVDATYDGYTITDVSAIKEVIQNNVPQLAGFPLSSIDEMRAMIMEKGRPGDQLEIGRFTPPPYQFPFCKTTMCIMQPSMHKRD